MSLMPEFIFRAVIARGMRAIRQDTRFLDQLFRNLDQQSAEEMREFILKKKLAVEVNYPRTTLSLPAIIILLKTESEETAYLSDTMGTGLVPDEMMYDDYSESDLDIMGGASAAATMTGLGRLVSGPHQAVTGTNNTVRISENLWKIDQWLEKTHTAAIISGRGVSQSRTIVANTQNSLMVSPNWSTNPDSTSVVEIRSDAGEIIGEPRSVYSRESSKRIERLGSLYRLSYQLQIIAPNPELTIYLHAIIKSIFTLSRTFLEKQGIIQLKMGATDFVPRPEYQPDHAYMRALNLEFLHPFDVFTELQDVATSLNIVLEDGNDNLEIVLSEVSV